MDLSARRASDARSEVQPDERFTGRDRAGTHGTSERLHVFERAALGVREARVVARVVRGFHVADDVRQVRMGEKPPHGVLVERGQVAGVEFLVVRDQKLLCDAAAKPRVEHLFEVRLFRRCARAARQSSGHVREVEVVQTLDELRLRELVNVLLERKIDLLSGVGNARALLDGADVLSFHPCTEPRFDFRVLEVEEVTRVVPGEAFSLDRLAIAADLVARFEDEVLLVAQGGGRGEAADAGTDDESAHGFHGRHICSGAEIPRSDKPRASTRAARSASARREARSSSVSALSTGHAS